MKEWNRKPTAAFLYKKLLESYRLCVKGKPSLKATQWHWRVEEELYRLSFELESKRYRPGLSSIFVVLNPKPREVIASNIRDRVVHRMLYEYMSPYWERRFLPNSYACRKGRGPLAAVRGAERFLKNESRTAPGRLFALKVDISRFFPSLDHEILLSQLKSHLENSFFLWLTELIVRHRSTAPGCYRLKSRKELWKRIEPEKSLFKVPGGKGLPIGNLTSQFFSNIYMHPLDVFLAKSRKGKFLYWQRYVDDVLIFGTDAKVLSAFAKEIDDFVQENLKLRLNPKKNIFATAVPRCRSPGLFYKAKPHNNSPQCDETC